MLMPNIRIDSIIEVKNIGISYDFYKNGDIGKIKHIEWKTPTNHSVISVDFKNMNNEYVHRDGVWYINLENIKLIQY